jgi:hypothetical protein
MLGGRFLCACWASNVGWSQNHPPTVSHTPRNNYVSVGIFTCTANPMWAGMHAPCILNHACMFNGGTGSATWYEMGQLVTQRGGVAVCGRAQGHTHKWLEQCIEKMLFLLEVLCAAQQRPCEDMGDS